MIENIIKKIDTLPPLPETIIQVEEFRLKSDQEVHDLVSILEKDPFVTSTLLKVGNSAIFAFKSKIETLSRLINLLGMKFTIYVTISETVQDLLTANLDPYCITNENLRESSHISTNLVNLWIAKIDSNLKDELTLPALLQRAGTLIISEIVAQKGLTKEFQEMIKNGEEVNTTEKQLVGITTSQVTAQIFKHWDLSKNFIDIIEYVDDLENCKDEFLYKSRLLEIIRVLSKPQEPLSENRINLAMKKAQNYGFDTKLLKNAIDILVERTSN